MKVIDVIFPVYINSLMGPTGTIRRLIANKSYLQSRGYELNVFTLDSFTASNKDLINPKPIDFSRGLSFRNRFKNFCRNNKYLSILLLLALNHKETKFIKTYIDLNRKPDFMVFHNNYTCYNYLSLTHTDSKVIIFHHNNGVLGDMLEKSYPKIKGSLYLNRYIKECREAIVRADQNVFISYEGFNNFREAKYVTDLKKLSVFHNGIDDKPLLDIPKVTDRKYNLCTTGTVCKRKGQYLIVEALSRLEAEKRRNIHLSIYGDGPDLSGLQALVNNTHLEDCVSFYGAVPNSEIHNKLSKNNIYILMSNNEGLPISIIEAMRAGLPIISTRISGIPEQVDSRNGILLDPDCDQLYQVLDNLDNYDWEALGAASRQRFDNEFTFTQMISSYCDMLDKVSAL